MLTLRVLPYDDSALRVEMHASNGAFAATQEFYCHPEDIRKFGGRLREFPTGPQDQVVWEIGSSDPKWAHHVRLRAYLVDALGHSALEVLADNRRNPPHRGTAEFSIRSDPASLNRLGNALVAWSKNYSRPLEWEPAA